MGYKSALGMRQFLPEEQALVWHLRHNHYPPISLAFLPVIREALEAVRRGDVYRKLTLPTGKTVIAATVVEEVHLEAFLGEPDEGCDEGPGS